MLKSIIRGSKFDKKLKSMGFEQLLELILIFYLK